jgi:hypothetical protein
MMSIKKLNHIFIASIFSMLSFSVLAAGLDDIAGYQPVAQAGCGVAPYAIQDIINKLPSVLDDEGIYKGGWIDFRDPRAVATDEEKFGKCEYFYIRMNGKTGGHTFEWALHYLFPENGAKKIDASEVIKKNLAEIDRESNSEYGVKECADWRNYAANLKEILNAVIQAAPAILKEKQRMVAAAKEAKLQEQNQANEKARAKQQAQEKAEADRRALELAERVGRDERANSLKACQATEGYKLYSVSATIEYNQAVARSAEMEIQHQKEASKISGVINKQVMYEMGNRVAGASRLNKENFEAYKKLGGAAKSIGAVKSLTNPCPQ